MKPTLSAVLRTVGVFALFAMLAVLSVGVATKGLQFNAAGLLASLQNEGPFDGKKLYDAALDAVAKQHKDLADPAAQKKFKQDWDSSRFDKTGELKTEEGTDKAIRQMLQSLGQRYDYAFDREDTKAEQDQVNSQLVGIGMTVKLNDQDNLLKALPKTATRTDAEKAMKIGKGHEMTVEGTLEGAPADGVLQKGDEIVKIDNTAVDGLLLKEAIAKIKGKENTDVSITVKRTAADGTTSEHTFKITRKVVDVKVVHTKDLGDGITYVKVDNFMSKNVVKEFKDALTKAAKGKGLIIDLRGNPGGELNAVLTMGAYLLPEGTLLEMHQRDGNDIVTSSVAVRKEFLLRMEPDASDPTKVDVSISKRPPLLIPEDMPIVVLVDEHSASASEILSGLLQKAKRATIIGKTTVGKGVGQHVVDLPFGRRLHITTFEFLPGGKAMDWIGIIPDVDVTQAKDNGKTDNQLDTAKTTVKKSVADAEALAKKAEDTKKKNKDDHEQKLKSRKP